MNDTTARLLPHRRTLGWVLLEFLGSMNLAITLLVVLAVASVIGTVLQQNQPYSDYVLKFGPFWFEVFGQLGLYDVYGTAWFLSILAFLILSTSVCIYRQAPTLWREMTRFRTQVRLDSLRGFHQQAEWQLPKQTAATVLQAVGDLLQDRGYRWQVADYGDHQVVAAMQGRFNRLGYLLTHVAIVVIGIGGLLDSHLWLKWKEWNGELRIETRDLAARDIPPESRLTPSATTPSFRGNVMLPEGSAANFVFLRVRDGFVLQELPFAIELKDFQVAYYDTGQPKSFVSEVLIHDEEHLGAQPLAATIRVNHPFIYRGYTIYQSDFGDGGSKLDMQAWPLAAPRLQAVEVKGEVGGTLKIGESAALTLELDDFRLFNLLPELDAQPGNRAFRNFGPSFGFKLRNATGEAREYFNYMAPVQMEGRWFYITGMRAQPGDPFVYLHIPADAKNSPERFLRFNARLHDGDWLQQFFAQSAPAGETADFQRDFNRVRLSLIELVTQGGFNAVAERARTVVPADRLQEATTLYLNIVRDSLAEVFVEVLREEGQVVEQGIDERAEAFFNDAVSALSVLPNYGSPFYLQLTGFQQVEASGLQVTRSPGAMVVYLGFALLSIGVFVTFYTVYRRLWVWLAEEEGAIRLVLAGVVNRRQAEFTGEFAGIVAALEQRLSPARNSSIVHQEAGSSCR